MWKHREMQMRNLADLSRYILETPLLRSEWGEEWWKIAFDACGSPSDWASFQTKYKSDRRAGLLRDLLSRIDTENQALPRAKIHHPVVLPALDY